MPALGGPDQVKAGHVGRCDEEEQPNGPKKDPEKTLHVPDDGPGQGLHLDPPPRVEVRELLFQPLTHDRHLLHAQQRYMHPAHIAGGACRVSRVQVGRGGKDHAGHVFRR